MAKSPKAKSPKAKSPKTKKSEPIKKEVEAPSRASSREAPKRESAKKTNAELKYFNGELVQAGDACGIYFRGGRRAATGVVNGRDQDDPALIQVKVDKDAEEFVGEDGEHYEANSTIVIHGSYLLPIAASEAKEASRPNKAEEEAAKKAKAAAAAVRKAEKAKKEAAKPKPKAGAKKPAAKKKTVVKAKGRASPRARS
jgi:hypothetical protein